MIGAHRLRRRVQFHETDVAGIVHFSWFNRYMEEAEHALWREAGLSIAAPDAEVGFPRIAASFEFHRPLHFEEEFDVRLRIVEIASKTIRYEAQITRGQTSVATGSLTVVCVSKRHGEPMQAVPIPRDIVDRLCVVP
jgi:YbgC/YbaW family acyl-CoA thioester hydrolase